MLLPLPRKNSQINSIGCDFHALRLPPPWAAGNTHALARRYIRLVERASVDLSDSLCCACTQGRINYEEFVKVMMSTKQAI